MQFERAVPLTPALSPREREPPLAAEHDVDKLVN